MALSNDLISQFVKITQNDKQTNKESTAYGKIVKQGDVEYVKLDGSDLLTPIESTTVVKDGDRVIVTIKNHTAIVTGDFTNPSANNEDVKEIGNKISEFEIVIADKVTTEQLEAEIAKIDKLIADNIEATNGKFETIEGKVAEIDTIKADIIEVEGKITAHEGEFTTIRGEIADFENLTAENFESTNANIHNLEADYAEFKKATVTDLEAANADIGKLEADYASFKNATAENFEATNADIDNLEAEYASFKETTTEKLNANEATITELETKKLDAESAKIIYANIDFSNIGEAAIEKLFSESGIIKDLIMNDGKVTGELVGVTIKGDLIEGNTIKADKLVVLGEDGLYYKLNVNSLGEATASSDEKYQNGLDGSVIIAKSITADRVAVTDLVAFGATIGGFNITDKSIYSGAKASATNTLPGIYQDKEGQFAVGDDINFVKFYKDQNGQFRLEISADTIAFGSEKKTVESLYEAVNANSEDLTEYIEATNKELESLQGQIDGSIMTWFYEYVPTNDNAPASDWNTTDLKNNHLGDLFYDTITGYCYRWQVQNNQYSWNRITDVDVTKALADAKNAQDTADNKRRVFVDTPTTPYDIGDLWVQGTNGDIMRCKTAKTKEQSYASADWVKASKYTDDTAVNALGTRVTEAETKIEQNSEAIELRATKTEVTTEIDTKINNISVGGRNLLINSSFAENNLKWEEIDDSPYFSEVNGKKCAFFYVSSIDDGKGLTQYLPKCLESDTEYTISGWFRTKDVEKNDNSIMYVIFTAPYGSGYTDQLYMEIPDTSGEWKHISHTFRTSQYDEDMVESIKPIVQIFLRKISCEFAFCNLKLEKGNIATDWTPAPEDSAFDIIGKNLLLNSSFTKNVDKWDNIRIAPEIVEYDGMKCARFIHDSINTSNGVLQVFNEPLRRGVEYTISGFVNMSYDVFIEDNDPDIGFYIRSDRFTSQLIRLPSTSGWQYVTHTFTVPDNDASLNNLALLFGGYGMEGNVYFYNFKLEKGDTATEWTAAPEDIENELHDNYYTKVETDAQIKVASDAISLEVSRVETNITNNYYDKTETDAQINEVEKDLADNYYNKTETDAKIKIEADKITQTVTRVETVEKNAVVSSVEEFYLSTSPTELSGGSWSTNQPTWTNGMYIWKRTLVTKGDGTTSYQPNQNGICISGNDGKDGADGKDGSDGKDGLNGKDGVDGKDGLNGKDGVDGKDGEFKDLLKSFEGEYVTLLDAADHKFIEFSMRGKTEQETRSESRNIFNKNNEVITSLNLGDKNILDTGVRIIATAGRGYNAEVNVVMKLGNQKELEGKTIRIKTTATPSANNLVPAIDIFCSNPTASVYSYKETITLEAGTSGELELEYLVRTMTDTDYIVALCLYATKLTKIAEGDYIDYANFMVTVDDEDMTYEPYGTMPSPDNPSEIENVVGKNKFNYKKASDVNNTTISAYRLFEISGLKPNTKYTLSGYDITSTTTAYIYLWDRPDYSTSLKAFISSPASYNAARCVTLTSGDNGCLYLAMHDTTEEIWNEFIQRFEKAQLEIGITNTNFRPYNSIEVKTSNKNKINMAEIEKGRLDNGVVGYVNDTSNIILNDDSFTYTTTAKYRGVVSGPIPIQEGQTITYSQLEDFNEDIGAIASFYDKNGSFISNISLWSKTITVPTGSRFLKIWWSKTEIGTQTITNPQLEIGETATEYERHRSNIAYFPLEEGQKLMEGSYLAEDGVHNKRKQYKFTGNETYIYQSQSNDPTSLYVATNMAGLKTRCIVLSNYFPNGLSVGNNTNKIGALYSTYIYFGVPLSTIGASSSDDNNTKIQKFQEWLMTKYENENPIILEYELIEEQIVPYTEEQQAAWDEIEALTSYTGTTHIHSYNEINPIFYGKYYTADSEDFNNILDTEINEVRKEIQTSTTNILQDSQRIMFEALTEYVSTGDFEAYKETVSTQFIQTANDLTILFNNSISEITNINGENSEQLKEIQKYIRFVDGDIVLGEVGNEITLKIQNDRIAFLQKNIEVAYFSNNKLYVTEGEFINSLQLGNFAFLPRDNGSLSFGKVGG